VSAGGFILRTEFFNPLAVSRQPQPRFQRFDHGFAKTFLRLNK
jgi:hypothetical protein